MRSYWSRSFITSSRSKILTIGWATQQDYTTHPSQRCWALVEDVICSNQSLLVTRHCPTHTGQYTIQVLFKYCQRSEAIPWNNQFPCASLRSPLPSAFCVSRWGCWSCGSVFECCWVSPNWEFNTGIQGHLGCCTRWYARSSNHPYFFILH